MDSALAICLSILGWFGEIDLIAKFVVHSEFAISPWLFLNPLAHQSAALPQFLKQRFQVRRKDVNPDGRMFPCDP